jgi:hypothetical protein
MFGPWNHTPETRFGKKVQALTFFRWAFENY